MLILFRFYVLLGKISGNLFFARFSGNDPEAVSIWLFGVNTCNVYGENMKKKNNVIDVHTFEMYRSLNCCKDRVAYDTT